MTTAKFSNNLKRHIFFSVLFALLLSILGIPLAIIWLLGFGQYISQKYYDSLSCELTPRALKFSKGIIFRIEKTIPLDNIQDLTLVEGPLLRYFNLAILKVETASSHGAKMSSDLKLVGIENAIDFRNLVIETRENIQIGAVSIPKSNAAASTDAENSAVLKEIRDYLKILANKHT